ncbi:MAG: hypothetical protein SGI73_13870 [Chloroflexota bacterium]|nr:hypothetical protein [Chloroflexota bacterium]
MVARWLLSIHWLGLSRLMARDLARPRAPVDSRGVEALLRKGERAYVRGDARRAHDYWRAAAALAPYDERIWRALLGVVETDADRRACLQNIVAINPLNADARRALLAYDGRDPNTV